MPITELDLYKSGWLELVFDDRNKAYGAYDLRKHYADNLLKALGFTIGGFVVLMLVCSFFMTRNPYVKVTQVVTDPTIVARQTVKPPVTPPKQRVEPPAQRSTVRFPQPTPVRDEVAENPPKIEDLQTIDPGQETVKGDGGISIPELSYGKGGEVAKAAEDNGIHEVNTIEIMPQFPGGEAAWAKFLQKNLRYPGQAQENNISGKVWVSFVIEKDGHLSDINVIRGVGYGLDDEAVRVLKLAPAWKPGIQNGQAVRVRYNLPFNFQIPPSD